MTAEVTVPLHAIAHARAGDKGDRLNVSVIGYDRAAFPCLLDQVTEARVAALFAGRKPLTVRRYALPKLGALNFVVDHALGGGVNGSLCLDRHGKTLAFLVLTLSVRVPKALVRAPEEQDNGKG